MKNSFWNLSVVAMAAGVLVLGTTVEGQSRTNSRRAIDWEPANMQSQASGLEEGEIESTGFEADAADGGWIPGWVCGPDFEAACVPCPDSDSCDADLTCGNGQDGALPAGWWLSGSATSCVEPRVETVNPFEGTQHIRFKQDPLRFMQCNGFTGPCRMSLFTPTVGPFPVGKTVVSLEVAGSATFGSDLIYQAQQNITGGVTGLFRFGYYGTILMYDNINGGYVDTGVYWSLGGTYTNATIESDPCAGTISYFYGGDMIFQREQGGAFTGNTVEGTLWLTDNFSGNWDLDNFSVVRDPACPTTCGENGIEPGEECDPEDDSPCPGRCVPAGEENECTCELIGGTCETATALSNGTTEFPPTHGGWFTWVADVPSYAIDTCGSTGFDSFLAIWEGASCDDLALIATNDDCDDDPAGCCGAGTDPLASCNPVGPPWESCTCVSTTAGQQYYAWVIGAANTGSFSNVTLSKRLVCEEIWENGACCDHATGTCTDDVAEDQCVDDGTGCLSFTLNKQCGSEAAGACDIIAECVIGACCDTSIGAGGDCVDGVLEVDCSADWTEAVACGDLAPACAEVTGACCDSSPGAGGACSVTISGDCQGAQQVWSEGADCGAVSCDEAIGACCNREDGTCSLTLLADCPSAFDDDQEFGWTKGASLAECDCEPAFEAIPTVSEWGLVIMTLLLLTGAKIYFGRRRLLTA